MPMPKPNPNQAQLHDRMGRLQERLQGLTAEVRDPTPTPTPTPTRSYP